MAQTVESLPAMQETWVQSLSWRDALKKGMATHSSILAWTREAFEVHGMAESDMIEQLTFSLSRGSLNKETNICVCVSVSVCVCVCVHRLDTVSLIIRETIEF